MHCYLLAAEVTEEVGRGDGSAGDNDGDADGDDDDDDDSDNAMDEEGVGTSCGSATKGKQKIEDKVNGTEGVPFSRFV